MKRPFSLGDVVGFKTNTGQYSEGTVIHRIVEKRQPTIFLIECADHRRAFRFETELELIAAVEEIGEGVAARYESLAIPVFASAGADD